MTVGQGPTALVVGAGGGVWTFLLSSVLFSPLSPSLWETARYRLKYCLKGPLNPKQPTNQSIIVLLAEVYARVGMWVRKLAIKVLSIFKTFPCNIITFFNFTVCQVC